MKQTAEQHDDREYAYPGSEGDRRNQVVSAMVALNHRLTESIKLFLGPHEQGQTKIEGYQIQDISHEECQGVKRMDVAIYVHSVENEFEEPIHSLHECRDVDELFHVVGLAMLTFFDEHD